MVLDTQAINFLIETVRRASTQEIMPRFRQLDDHDVVEKSSAADLVTIADQSAERYISHAIQKEFPDWHIVGEEAVAEDETVLNKLHDDAVSVIIDPIDGTWNYANGVAIFGVILAVVENGETVCGLLYDPVLDDWLSAIKGEGSYYFRDNKPIKRLQISPKASLDDMIGFVPFARYPQPIVEILQTQMSRFQRLAGWGCSCHEYRAMCMANFDFSLSMSLMPWDHAAGELILREAGGYSRLLTGEVYKPTMLEGHMLSAPNENNWQQLQAVFLPAFEAE